MGRLLRLVLAMSISGGSAGGTISSFDPVVTEDSNSVLDAGSGANDWVGRASIKERSDGTHILAYYKATNHFNNEGAVHVRFSDDYGATWTAEDTKLGGGAVSGAPFNPTGSSQPPDSGEPWLMVAPNGDLLLHTWLIDYSTSMGGSWQWRSSDDGHSWTAEGQITFVGIPSGDDQDWVFSTDDDFVWDGVIYAGARIYSGGADGTPSKSVLIVSDDNGASWTIRSVIMDDDEGDSPNFGGQEVGLEYIGNDTILAMIRDNAHTKSFKRVSTDLGVTWGSLTDVTSLVGIAGRQRVYTRSHVMGLDGWWKDPRLIMVGFVHQTSGSSTDRRTAVWFSPDRGTTWDGPHYLHTTTEDGGYSDIMYDRDNDLFRVIGYSGTLATASMKQWNLDISGLF